MRCEFRLRQRIAVLEGKEEDSSSSPRPHLRRRTAGERGTPYARMSMRTQMARWTTRPPREVNSESWVGDGSADLPLRLVPIQDVVVTPALSSSDKEGEYHKAPVTDEEGGITEVSNSELDLVGSKESPN